MRRRVLLLAALAAAAARPAGARTAEGLVVHDRPRPLPEIDIRDDRSKPAGLALLRGRPVLVNLWASWCGPCVAELPTIDRARPRLEREGVSVMALSLDRTGKVAVVNTYARLGIRNLGVHTDEERRAAEAFAVPVLPVTLLLDREGREVARYVGATDWDGPEARRWLAALAGGRPLGR